MHSASFFYLWIYSTKIKSFICGRVKLPDVTELIFYFYLLLNILKVKDTCCALAYCILSELHVVQLFKNRREIHDNREKISQRKVTAVLSSQIWFRLFYRGVKGRLSFLLKSASLNMHAWVKFDP